MAAPNGLEGNRIRVLVADDEPITRRVLEMHLKRWGYDVLTAEDGHQARQMLAEHRDIRLMITDWMMPGFDGLELCRFARSQAADRPRYLHIIMLTVKSERSELLTAMDAGADAFLVKPVNASELEAQIRVARRILDLDEQNRSSIEKLDAIYRRIQRDMEAAARVQQSFLPSRVLTLPRVRCVSHFESSHHVAGDMFNVLRLPDDRVAVYVLDVSGHGTQAALLSVSVHLLLDSLSSRSQPHRRSGLDVGEDVSLADPEAVLQMLNRRFQVMGRRPDQPGVRQSRQSNQYFTMVYGILDPATREFCYARGGHPWPVVVGPEGARALEGADGPALGIFGENQFRLKSESVRLEPGGFVVLYSDGVVEVPPLGAKGRQEEYGEERMLQILASNRDRGVEAAIDALIEDVRQYAGPQFRDDVTVLGLEILD